MGVYNNLPQRSSELSAELTAKSDAAFDRLEGIKPKPELYDWAKEDPHFVDPLPVDKPTDQFLTELREEVHAKRTAEQAARIREGEEVVRAAGIITEAASLVPIDSGPALNVEGDTAPLNMLEFAKRAEAIPEEPITPPTQQDVA